MGRPRREERFVMRAIIPTTHRLPADQPKPKGKHIRWRLWPKRRQPTLFQKCLAVHMAGAGKPGALR